jgi:hypothetical protein
VRTGTSAPPGVMSQASETGHEVDTPLDTGDPLTYECVAEVSGEEECMSSFSPLELTAAAWAVVAAIYLALFLYRSIVGMKEEDNLYLSAGESRMAEEQRGIMKRINRIEPYTKGFGWATLAMSVLVASIWGYSVYRQLF